MTSDLDLLRQFARENSQEAFAEIVRRHLDLIYSAAVRQVRSPQLAEEVAQSVFTDLARNAGNMSGTGVPPVSSLTPWLYAVTRRTAIDVVRKESRRRLREQIAAEMNAQNEISHFAKCENQSTWTEIASLLDEAVSTLDDLDRSAILLRYFENKSMREVSETLGTTDDAAQKRVSRAVGRLREFFAKRGVTVGASGLVVVLSANAVQAAPVELAAAISATALAGTAVTTSTVIAAAKTIAMTTLQKAVVTATVAVLAGAGIYEARQAAHLREQNQTLQQQQAPLAAQIQQWQRERDDAMNRFAGLLAENEQLKSNSNTAELLRLRAEVTRLHNESRRPAQAKANDADDSTAIAARAWIERAKLLKERFAQWLGKTTPELQLLSEQDWLNEAANRELDSDDACRKAMSDLRRTAIEKFSGAVNQVLGEFTKSNNGRLPSDLSELKPYLKPPLDSILDGYEIAKPGWVHPPQPNSPNSKNAETWALVMKGSFSPDGSAIRDASYLADPDYDMTIVIYNGGWYGYGPDKPSK